MSQAELYKANNAYLTKLADASGPAKISGYANASSDGVEKIGQAIVGTMPAVDYLAAGLGAFSSIAKAILLVVIQNKVLSEPTKKVEVLDKAVKVKDKAKCRGLSNKRMIECDYTSERKFKK